MLHEILRAYDGKLPDGVHVAFANTGKEREETLRFVHECGSRWGVSIHWVEWRDTKPCFEEVGYNSASRAGEPFDAIIAKKMYLPNALTRFCTSELKIRAMRDFARSLGWPTWTNVVGLRYDEGHRVLKALDRSESRKDPWRVLMPLSTAKVTLRHIREFWVRQDFDLQLLPHEGNCDLCFLKGAAKLREIMRNNPGLAPWWIGHEAERGAPFRKYGEASYAELKTRVDSQYEMTLDPGEDEYDVECGLLCGSEE
jgi:3'-phosphoadenosine 5'-phosphosulfate sulfotransferase (PAPS reductase)/FAD synthetase